MSTKIAILILLFISFFSHTENTPKPNFIIIYLDDMGYSDVGIYKDERLKTPNIDLLSSSGQVWTNFYASSAQHIISISISSFGLRIPFF